MRVLVVLALVLGACTTSRQPTTPPEATQPVSADAAVAAPAAPAAPAASPAPAEAGHEGSGTTSVPGGSAHPVIPTLDELRASHPVRNEGATCAVDDNCDPPLRCMAQACAFPGAMTGAHDTSTPLAVFYTADGDRTYYLELASTPAERTRGLMFRRSMVGDWGMLFLFDAERQQTFWMRNTLIGLDMVFIRSDMHVDSIQANATPQTDTPRPSAGPAQFVLELNSGEAARVGIVPGTRVEFLNLPSTGG